MAHELEMIGDKAQMAYVGELPWHGLGTKVPADLTPIQMLDAAGLNWEVEKIPAYADVGGRKVSVGRAALVRKTDNKVLDVVSDDWNIVQNEEAFAFFNDFIAAGEMEMHTAGSLKGGQIVWALARIKEGFELFGGDEVIPFLLFTNFHRYGFSTDVRFTPIRTVCWNTLSLALNSHANRVVKVSHRRQFVGDDVKEMLGVAKEKLATYKEMAAYLGSKKYKGESVVEYFERIFPMTSTSEKRRSDISKNAGLAYELMGNQPGHEFAEGTWWQAFNAVTYITDHLAGRSADTRLTSAWYGANKTLKTKALELAVEFADAA